ncbi:MAG TPA: hypothetical protein VFM99_11550, partial [Chitinophagales bacterium]|nr:hypothetical protein [Chitinophagales bacterium]
MSKGMIWFLITLMSIAVIGLGAIQYYWIYSAIQTNEEKFRSDVFDVLNRVAEKLRSVEGNRLYKSSFESNGKTGNVEDDFEYKYLLRMLNETSLAERISLPELKLYLSSYLADKDIT